MAAQFNSLPARPVEGYAAEAGPADADLAVLERPAARPAAAVSAPTAAPMPAEGSGRSRGDGHRVPVTSVAAVREGGVGLGVSFVGAEPLRGGGRAAWRGEQGADAVQAAAERAAGALADWAARPAGPALPRPPRTWSAAEERAHALSHGLAALAALAALPVLAVADRLPALAAQAQAGLVLYLLAMVAVFGVSALFHAWPPGAARRRLQRLDHALIFLFIAASATVLPLCRPATAAAAGDALLLWLAATMGAAWKLRRPQRPGLARSLLVFVLFAGAGCLQAWPTVSALPTTLQAVLAASVAVYLLGAACYAWGWRRRGGHLAWHLCAVAGSGLQLAVVWLAVRGG